MQSRLLVLLGAIWFYYLFFAVLGIQLRALSMLDKHSILSYTQLFTSVDCISDLVVQGIWPFLEHLSSKWYVGLSVH